MSPPLSSTINPRTDLQEIIQGTNKNMPVLLQDKCKFSLLGYYESDFSGNEQLERLGQDKNKHMNFTSDGHHLKRCTNNHGRWSCGWLKVDVLLEQGRLAALGNMWIKIVYGLPETIDRKVSVFPKLVHLHWNRETTFPLDLHM
ncbi:hypothetical protein Salat_2937100 [Sesamum alatum]|uniref:Uncharacterized protein n=1 Tax=Sesamum alatum TaxID=300844 RepID=A0AAE1XJK2_9LAMI|nr:hypothetical protein Salat_2937100 [Sesamum alatum]